MDPDTKAARALLGTAARVAVLTGAGVSAESGIPTFRDAMSGHWARFRPEDLASPAAYARDPDTVWAWYAGRYRDVTAAQPNPAHAALAAFERRLGEGFLLATQNVDGLHARAGSERLLELHGNLGRARCEVCGAVSALPPPEAFEPPPRCGCGARMRPHIVWFGEYLDPAVLDRAAAAFAAADAALVVGTSAHVHPAAGLALETLRAGGAVIEVNPEQTELSPHAAVCLRGAAAAVLPALLQ